MILHHKRRFWGAFNRYCALLLSLLIAGSSSLGWATPPIPPARIILDERVVVKFNSSQEGILPIRLEFREQVSELDVQVKVRPVIEKRPDFAQPAFETILEKRLEGEAIRKMAQEPINIDLRNLKPGQYQLEIFVNGKNPDGGFSDKQIWRLVIDTEKRYRLLNMHDVIQNHVRQQEAVFKERLQKDPKNPDIRLLMDDTVAAPVKSEQIVSFDVPESQKILVRPAGVSERFKGYYQEHEGQSWSSNDPITVKGRLVFLDVDGVWKPLVNAAVHLWDDDTFGDDHLGSVATDWDGRWSFSVNNDDGFLQDGRDIYYTFKLENTRWKVGKCSGDYEWQSATHDDLNDGTVLDFGNETASTDNNSLVVWSALNLAWNQISTAGGQDPGFIEACFPGSGTFYNGKVNVAAADFDGDGVIHEYGHALMAKANGSDPSPGGAHGFGDCNQNQALSWSEGWATGFMLSVRPDNTYNWHFGDTGRNIENFSSSCQLGETSEGRVAASLLDFMDSANDDNGGSTNRGRNDASDHNSGNLISLATLFRDTMWGNSPNNNFLNYWYSLSGNLTSAQRTPASDIPYYNWMSVLDPDACAATRITASRMANPESVLSGLRKFRDLALKKFPEGRQLANDYYRNSPEITQLLLQHPDYMPDALNVIGYFSGFGDTIGNNERYKKTMASDPVFVPEKVQVSVDKLFSLFEKQGGETLRLDAGKARQSYERYRGMKLSELQETVIREKADLKAGSAEERLKPTGVSKESQQALKNPELQRYLKQQTPTR